MYATADLLYHVEHCVAELSHDYPLAEIILAGDLNKLQDDDIVERTGLTQIVRQPTRGANLLDRVFVSDPQLYSTVRVVPSVVKTDHKAVVALPSGATAPNGKTRQRRTFRHRTPSQNAIFLHTWRRSTWAPDRNRKSLRARPTHKRSTTHFIRLQSVCLMNSIQSAPSP